MIRWFKWFVYKSSMDEFYSECTHIYTILLIIGTFAGLFIHRR